MRFTVKAGFYMNTTVAAKKVSDCSENMENSRKAYTDNAVQGKLISGKEINLVLNLFRRNFLRSNCITTIISSLRQPSKFT